MSNAHVAACLHAFCIDSSETRINLFNQILSPTISAKCVFALSQSVLIRFTHRVIADQAISIIIFRKTCIDLRIFFCQSFVENYSKFNFQLRLVLEPLCLHKLIVPAKMSGYLNEGILVHSKQLLHRFNLAFYSWLYIR